MERVSNNGNAGARPAVGDLLAGRYRLDDTVGHGGMATVYRATDEALGRTVAIKMFESELAHANDVRRQRDEISLLATLNHPSLVTLFDAVADDLELGVDRSFVVLEFVAGPDLSEALENGPVDRDTTALMGADVADALDYIHARGVVHRDVKPGNILLPADESGNRVTAKLADFGIARLVDGAKLTETGSFLGTASYLSPEQARGETVGPPSDVYSLGLVLLECLTGARAFPGTALEATAARLSRDPVIPAELGPNWTSVLRSMTSMSPEHRPTAARAADSLRSLATIPASPDPTLVLPAHVPTTEPLQADSQSTEAQSTEAQSTEAPLAELDTTPSNAPGWQSSPSPTAATRSRRRLPPVAWGIIGAFVLAPLLWLGISSLSAFTPQPPAENTPSQAPYPAIDGELGDHLEQLQRTVER